MADVTISGAGAHASAAATDRIPASKGGVKGYLTPAQLASYTNTALGLGALSTLNTVGTAQIDNDSVTFAKLQNATGAGFIGATGAGDFSERTPTQVTAALDVFTGDAGAGGVKGLVPAPAAGDG